MAVSLIELAAALRLGDGVTAPTEPVAGLLSRLLGVSQAFVAIAAPEAPEAIADEATIRMTAYLYDAPTASSGDRYAAAYRNSGAESLLSRWVVRRAQGEVPVLEEVDPGQPVRLLGWSNDETIDAADLAAAGIESFEDALPIPQHDTANAYLWGATWLSDLPTSVGSSAGPLPRRDDVTYNGIVWAVFRSSQLIETRLADFGLSISFRYNGRL